MKKEEIITKILKETDLIYISQQGCEELITEMILQSIKEPEENNSELIKEIEDRIIYCKSERGIYINIANYRAVKILADEISNLQSILNKLKETE